VKQKEAVLKVEKGGFNGAKENGHVETWREVDPA